jgi:uncharacterized protein YcgI (DUF1989 family)
VRIEEDGTTMWQGGPFVTPRSIVLRAEMNVIVIVANCPHVLDERSEYSVTPARVCAWRGPITPADDAIRNATLESSRAFLNVEEYFRR